MISAKLIIAEGNRCEVEEDVFRLSTDWDAMFLLRHHNCDFRAAAKAVSANLKFDHVSYYGELKTPEAWILGHLKRRYRLAIGTYLKTLGVHIVNDVERGLAVLDLEPCPSDKDSYICVLDSCLENRSYDPQKLLDQLTSMRKATFADIWHGLKGCEISR